MGSQGFETFRKSLEADLNIFHKNKFTVKGFDEKWDEMSEYVEATLKLLEEKNAKGFGVNGKELLPYEPMIPILASLLSEIATTFKNSNNECYKKFQQYYWVSVFSQRYTSSVQSRKTEDFGDMVDWFGDDNKKPFFMEQFKITNLNLRNETATRSAIYRGLLCLLRKNGAEDMEKAINVGDQKLHRDHIFPRSKFGSEHENETNVIQF